MSEWRRRKRRTRRMRGCWWEEAESGGLREKGER